MKGDFDKQKERLSSLIGLIVVCIKENGIGSPHQIESTIKKGKKYRVTNAADSSTYSSQFYYQVISDEGEKLSWIPSEHFIPLYEIREEKLNELGI